MVGDEGVVVVVALGVVAPAEGEEGAAALTDEGKGSLFSPLADNGELSEVSRVDFFASRSALRLLRAFFFASISSLAFCFCAASSLLALSSRVF